MQIALVCDWNLFFILFLKFNWQPVLNLCQPISVNQAFIFKASESDCSKLTLLNCFISEWFVALLHDSSDTWKPIRPKKIKDLFALFFYIGLFQHIILTFLFKNAKFRIKKKKKKRLTLIFQNFGLVGKGQTNIFFLGLINSPNTLLENPSRAL